MDLSSLIGIRCVKATDSSLLDWRIGNIKRKKYNLVPQCSEMAAHSHLYVNIRAIYLLVWALIKPPPRQPQLHLTL